MQTRIPVLCAFCRNPRRVYRKRRAKAFDYAAMALISVVLMYVVFGGLDPRALIFYAVAMVTVESCIQFRWRLSVTCSHCGFDPVMYVKDQEKAAAKVKAHLERRRDNVDYLLAPPVRLPTRRQSEKQGPRRSPHRGQNLSKQV